MGYAAAVAVVLFLAIMGLSLTMLAWSGQLGWHRQALSDHYAVLGSFVFPEQHRKRVGALRDGRGHIS